jgi:hypothetical protein
VQLSTPLFGEVERGALDDASRESGARELAVGAARPAKYAARDQVRREVAFLARAIFARACV